ncbi:MAG: SH3 domain-containing protein [Clostridia bacterium]|nr:SH3 domain-containing protein [Clostridia bacterium]
MKKCLICLTLILLLTGLAAAALAGENILVVATDLEGTPAYASASGGKQAGILYNGFRMSIALESKQGRYACALTKDTTVWVNQKKAMKYSDVIVGDTTDMPCSCYLAEVTVDGAKLWSTTRHQYALAEHRKGTLVLVCGAFGKDFYVTRAGHGFMSGSVLRKVRDLTFDQAQDHVFGLLDDLEAATVYLDQPSLSLSASATGISEESMFTSVKNGGKVLILRDLGDWVQVAVAEVYDHYGPQYGGFIEKRYLDPEGDHSPLTAVVKTDHPLNRLNVRQESDKDSWSLIKLCSGARVQVISSANGWTEIEMYAEAGRWKQHGYVKSAYLAFGAEAESVPDACVRVRLRRDYKDKYSDEAWAAGTEGRLIGVEEPNRFVIRLDSGEVVSLSEEETEPLLEPIDPPLWEARTTKQASLRKGPSADTKKIRTLKSGVTVTVLLRGEKWALVRVNGEEGYVLSNVLKPKKLQP